MTTIWDLPNGRELDSTPLPDSFRPKRLVACVNVWNDINALRRTASSWMRYVDHIIAVDGAYKETGYSLSTDGTREFFQALKNVTLVDAPGLDQCAKRTTYFNLAREGDYLLIVDADEQLIEGHSLNSIPECDVGWIRISSSMYKRTYGQPRLIRWQPNLHYRGRHHWIYCGDRLLCTHQYGGNGFAHRTMRATLINQRRLGRSTERIAVKNSHHSRQVEVERVLSAIPESVMSDSSVNGREALHILMYAYRDDGLAPSRLHTAVNRTTPHSSVLVKTRPGPFGVQEQYLAGKHTIQLRQALGGADIVHYHVSIGNSIGIRQGARIVFHHHGTMLRNNSIDYAKQAKDRNALVLVSNLELLSWTQGMTAYFLPNTVPVARYLALRNQQSRRMDGVIKIAHSPSHPQKKGTDKLERVVAHLKSKGYPLELVMIHDKTHRASLLMKSECHIAFDSFWLGIQCSGVECAAMRMPVIAGDTTVRDRYVEHFGECPYTFAENEEQLEAELKAIIESPDYYDHEARRVHSYVTNHHDESAVSLRYLDLLDITFGWRSTPLSAPRPVRSSSLISGHRVTK